MLELLPGDSILSSTVSYGSETVKTVLGSICDVSNCYETKIYHCSDNDGAGQCLEKVVPRETYLLLKACAFQISNLKMTTMMMMMMMMMMMTMTMDRGLLQ